MNVNYAIVKRHALLSSRKLILSFVRAIDIVLVFLEVKVKYNL